jgi:hypothetical protein
MKGSVLNAEASGVGEAEMISQEGSVESDEWCILR